MEMRLHYPDEPLDFLQLSLAQFVTLSNMLLNMEAADATTFVRFVLAGRLEMNGKSLRVSINAKQGAPPPPVDKYDLYRDIDSVIGITQDLPFKRPLAVFPLASFRDTLTKDNHVTYKLPGTSEVRFH